MQLDGSASSDPEGKLLKSTWTRTSGPAVTLYDADTAKPRFSVPNVGTTLTFRLVVNDGERDSEPATVNVR